MIVKRLLIFMLGFHASFYANAQLENWKASVFIYPDEQNQDGCVMTSENLFPIIVSAGESGWEFTFTDVRSLLDVDTYFGAQNPNRVMFTFSPQELEKMLLEPEKNQHFGMMVRWGDRLIPCQLKYDLQKLPAKNQSKYNYFTCIIENYLIGIPSEGKVKFTLKLSTNE